MRKNVPFTPFSGHELGKKMKKKKKNKKKKKKNE